MWIALLLALSTSSAFAFNVGCSFGTQCISTQGTKIPANEVIELSGYCDDFTTNDIGAYALKLSLQEILQKSNGKPMHPLSVANYAWGKIHESPLKFNRKAFAEDTKYAEIKQSCRQLESDFNNKSKWSK